MFNELLSKVSGINLVPVSVLHAGTINDDKDASLAFKEFVASTDD